MAGRIGKITTKKPPVREPSPEIPTPVKATKCDDDIENKMLTDENEITPQSSCIDQSENKTDINPMAIILANGQPLLTNFEEKYLVDLILKSTQKDIEGILQEKIPFILQMNYGTQSTLFTLNSIWIYDFILKHFQTLINHINSQQLFEKFLKKNFDKNNSAIAFKHWQLQILVNEHSKKQQQQQPISQKRRMTVRRIDFN